MRKLIYSRFFIVLLFVLSANNINALNFYWIGGTGNWDDLNHWATTSGGTVLHNHIPRAVDDVFFDANSFNGTGQTITLNPLTILCNNMDWTGVTNMPSLVALTTSLLKIYGAVKFSPAMITTDFHCSISFEATTTGKMITMAGQSFNNTVDFNGIGGGWTLQDTFNPTFLNLNNGTLNTNNQTINTADFSSRGFGTRTLNMGSSVFNVWQWWGITGTGITLNCGTSIINMTLNGSTADFVGNGLTYYDVNFTGTGPYTLGYIRDDNKFHDVVFYDQALIVGSNTFHNATFKKGGEIQESNTYTNITFEPGYSYKFYEGTTQSVTGVINAAGNCGAYVDISSSIQGSQFTINHPAGAVNISFTILKDVQATGGASFTAANSINISNNTGWSFTSPAAHNLYWIGNGGNWNDGNHWAFTSGGTPSGCSPTPLDNVFFDANSFSLPGQVVAINIPTAYCRDITWSGITGTPSFTAPTSSLLKIYGSSRLSPAMITTGFHCSINFEATTTGKTITMAGQSFNNAVDFNGIGGGWTLQDTFNPTFLNLNNGTLNTNNQTINTADFSSRGFGTRTLNMGSSVFNVWQWWGITGTGITLNCGTSIINMTLNGSTADFLGNGLTYYDVNFTGTGPYNLGYIRDNNRFHDVVFYDQALIVGSNTFHNATFKKGGEIQESNTYTNITFEPGYSYKFYEGTTQSVTGVINAAGNCGAYVDISSSIQGSQFTINHPAGAVNISFTILKDVQATGGANFTAANSINISNNTGWSFTSPAAHNLYWIGNGGNWNDGNHWAFTSGGTPSGCSPTPLDNVFFDANSFSLPGQVVAINIPTAYCRDITWSGITGTPSFTAPTSSLLKIYGSSRLSPAMITTGFHCSINFEATTTGKTITMAGQSFNNAVDFNGIGGGWTLQDTFNPTFLNLNNGTLNTNNQTINTADFFSRGFGTRTLNMGSSVFNVWQWWGITGTGITLNCGTSIINMTLNGSTADFLGNGLTYYDVNFTGTGPYNLGYIRDNNRFHDVVFYDQALIVGSNTFHSATFKKDAEIQNNNTYNDLIFTAGYTYTLYSGTTQKVEDRWHIQGSCVSYIVLKSSVTGAPATVTKSSGSVAGYNIHIKDIHCTGGAVFNAYNSVDLGGNSGWQFSQLPPLLNPNLIQGPSLVCTGAGTVTYHIAPVPGAIYYEWTVPAGATIAGGQGDTIITVRFNAVTNGDITVQSFNGCNYGTRSSAFTVTAATAFTLQVSLVSNAGNPVCSGTAVTFTATISNAGNAGVKYYFKVNGTSVQDSTLNTYTTTSYSNNDIITCDITILNGGGCLNSTTASSNPVTITVNPGLNVAPTIAITASPSGPVCSGTPLTFTALASNTAGGSVIYNFKVNDISLQNGSSNIFTGNNFSNNDHVVCSISITGGTCLNINSAISNTIIVAVAPKLTPAVSIAPNPGTTICRGASATFTAAAINTGNGTIAYNFKVNGIVVQSGVSNIYTAASLSNGDRIDCDINITGGSCINSNNAVAEAKIIAVVDAVKPVIEAAAGASLCEQAVITLNAGDGFNGYMWNTGSSSPVIQITDFGSYSVMVTDVNGCTAGDTLEIINNCDCSLKIPNIFTPNHDGFYDKWVISHTTCIKSVKVAVYNRWGGLVYHSNNYQNDWEGLHNSTALPDATYYYIIEARNVYGPTGRIYRGNVTIMR